MGSDSEGAEEMRVDMGALVAAVLSRGLRILLVTVLLLLLATAAILLLVPKTYESSAKLLVEARPNVEAAALMASQIEQIEQIELLLDVIDQENLRSEPEFTNAALTPIGFAMRLIGRGQEQRSGDEIVLGNLADRVTVTGDRGSAVITVSVRSADPELAARIANGIAAAQVKRRTAQSLTDTADETAWLEDEIEKLRVKVVAAETAVADFKLESAATAESVPASEPQPAAVAPEVTEAEQRQTAAAARERMIRELVASGQSLDSLGNVRNSVVIQGMLQSKANLEAELAQQSTRLLGNHPTIKALKAQIADVGDRIIREANRVADSLEAEAKVDAAAQATRDVVAAPIEAESVAAEPEEQGATLEGLEGEAQAQRDLLDEHLAQYADAVARAASNTPLPDVRIVSQATPASQPVSPQIPLILGAVGLAALALQVGAVALRQMMSARVPADHREAEQAAMAIRAEAEAEEQAYDDELEAAVEQGIAPPVAHPQNDDLTQLSAAVSAQQLRIVLLATLDDDAGTLTVIDRLLEDALTSDLSAVVVDAASGEVSAAPGLTDLAAEQADYGDVLQRAGENLAEVSWGRTETLDRRSSRPMTLIEALADIYHVVIVDTGRAGVASSLPLFSGAHATVVLVANETTNPVAIGAARRDISALGFEVGRVVGLPATRADVA